MSSYLYSLHLTPRARQALCCLLDNNGTCCASLWRSCARLGGDFVQHMTGANFGILASGCNDHPDREAATNGYVAVAVAVVE